MGALKKRSMAGSASRCRPKELYVSEGTDLHFSPRNGSTFSHSTPLLEISVRKPSSNPHARLARKPANRIPCRRLNCCCRCLHAFGDIIAESALAGDEVLGRARQAPCLEMSVRRPSSKPQANLARKLAPLTKSRRLHCCCRSLHAFGDIIAESTVAGRDVLGRALQGGRALGHACRCRSEGVLVGGECARQRHGREQQGPHPSHGNASGLPAMRKTSKKD
mmetsp:Transcript_50060/g.141771  ORF Transcript_50060/g.141771 Transcript_50060/m.141771 type:complete len:221 (-) Transcript_50060:18-680(-)